MKITGEGDVQFENSAVFERSDTTLYEKVDFFKSLLSFFLDF